MGTHQVRQFLQNLVSGNLVQHRPRLAQFCFEPLAHLRVSQDVIRRDHKRDARRIGARTEKDASLVQKALARWQGATLVGRG